MSKLRYSEFVDSIDLDEFYEAIGWEPISHSNGNDIGFCPDWQGLHAHGDTTGKFAIHREKRVFNCFLCGGGSILSLAMELKDLDLDDATEWLYQFTHGDNRSDTQFVDDWLESLNDIEVRAKTLPYFNERVLDKFCGPIDWFQTRGIKDYVCSDYLLCYGEEVTKSAPVKVNQRTGERTKIDDDYIGPCAVFPHFWKDRLVGWQHRWIDWDKNHNATPKWLSKWTMTTDFPKNDTIFNYDSVLDTPDPVIVCESLPTVLFLASQDIPAVATFGASASPAQLRLLRRLQQGIVFAPDNDQASLNYINKATKYLERFIPVQHLPVVNDTPGSDLGDFAQDPESLFKHLDKAYDPGSWSLSQG